MLTSLCKKKKLIHERLWPQQSSYIQVLGNPVSHMDGWCHKNWMQLVLNGEKLVLTSAKTSYKAFIKHTSIPDSDVDCPEELQKPHSDPPFLPEGIKLPNVKNLCVIFRTGKTMQYT